MHTSCIKILKFWIVPPTAQAWTLPTQTTTVTIQTSCSRKLRWKIPFSWQDWKFCKFQVIFMIIFIFISIRLSLRWTFTFIFIRLSSWWSSLLSAFLQSLPRGCGSMTKLIWRWQIFFCWDKDNAWKRGVTKYTYFTFQNTWNFLDFTIVMIGFIDIFLSTMQVMICESNYSWAIPSWNNRDFDKILSEKKFKPPSWKASTRRPFVRSGFSDHSDLSLACLACRFFVCLSVCVYMLYLCVKRLSLASLACWFISLLACLFYCDSKCVCYTESVCFLLCVSVSGQN